MAKNQVFRTLLIDDHPVVLNGLKSLIINVPEIKIIAELSNGAEALPLLKSKKVDLIISDISMPKMDGIELAEHVKKHFPDIKIILLTAYNEREILKKALFSGAEACLLKNISKKELLEAIYRVMDNGYYYCDNLLDIARDLYEEPTVEPKEEADVGLSERELEVLQLLLKGYSSKEIATQLKISYHTVTTHRKNILKKTMSNNITGLFSYAKKHQLIT